MRRPKARWLLAPVLAGSLALNGYQALTNGEGGSPAPRPSPVVQERPPTLPCAAPKRISSDAPVLTDDGLCIQLLGSTTQSSG